MLELLFLPQHTTVSATPLLLLILLFTNLLLICLLSTMLLLLSSWCFYPSSSCSWCFLIICLPSTTCFCTSFFSASASTSTLPLLVLFYNLSRLSDDHWWYFVWQSCKLLLNKLSSKKQKFKKYPARCKSVDKKLAINVVHTAKYRKYMHVSFAINVIQTAKNRKYMHIDFAICLLHRVYSLVLNQRFEVWMDA